jgi:hypothetical protein
VQVVGCAAGAATGAPMADSADLANLPQMRKLLGPAGRS